jgi:hypothetical protein
MSETQAIEDHGFYYRRVRKIFRALFRHNPINHFSDLQRIKNAGYYAKMAQAV